MKVLLILLVCAAITPYTCSVNDECEFPRSEFSDECSFSTRISNSFFSTGDAWVCHNRVLCNALIEDYLLQGRKGFGVRIHRDNAAMLDALHKYAKRIENLYIVPSDKKTYEYIRDYAITMADTWSDGYLYGYILSWSKCYALNVWDNKHVFDFLGDAGKCAMTAGKDPLTYATAALYGTQKYYARVSLNEQYFEFHF